MIDLTLDPFSPGHEADLAQVGDELAPEAGVARTRLVLVGGWRALSSTDPWFPTARELRKGLWRWGPAGRVKDLLDVVGGAAGPRQDVVDDLRRHGGGPYGSAAHEHWRALAIRAVETPSIVGAAAGSAPALALLTDRDLVVLVRSSAAAMAASRERLAALEAGVVEPTGPLAPFRELGSMFTTLGRDVAAITRGERRPDGLISASRTPLAGSRVAPVSAVASVDHLRWRFADGSWLDVHLSHPAPAARREVLRRIGEAGVPVGPVEPFLLPT